MKHVHTDVEPNINLPAYNFTYSHLASPSWLSWSVFVGSRVSTYPPKVNLWMYNFTHVRESVQGGSTTLVRGFIIWSIHIFNITISRFQYATYRWSHFGIHPLEKNTIVSPPLKIDFFDTLINFSKNSFFNWNCLV